MFDAPRYNNRSRARTALDEELLMDVAPPGIATDVRLAQFEKAYPMDTTPSGISTKVMTVQPSNAE